MVYVCELGRGQNIYLDNQGSQTLITTVSSGPGQQQQASSSFHTGPWTATPMVFQIPGGLVLKIITAQGEHFIQVQGNSSYTLTNPPTFQQAQQLQVQPIANSPTSPIPPMEPMKPMEPMPPLEPMKPMQMGNMEMSLNPMQMRMGNMEMRMGDASATSSSTASSTASASSSSSPSSSSSSAAQPRRFCSQCGNAVKTDDRFCSSCGHALG